MNMRVMMIGFSGAGKTTYMGAMYSMLNEKSCQGFSLRAKKDSDHDKFLQIGARLAKGIYPKGTDILEEYQYSLLYKGKNVLDFDWYDYRGGVLASADSPDFDAVVSQIMNSDALVVFFDSTMFTPGETTERRCVNTWKRVMAIVQNVTARHPEGTVFPISFVFTKSDCCPEGVGETKGWKLFEQVVKMIREDEHGKICGICVETAVRCQSLRRWLVFKKMKYETWGLEYPFLFTMLAAMGKKCADYGAAKEHAIAARDKFNEKGGIWNEITSFFKGEQSNWDKANAEENKARELERQANKLYSGPMKKAWDYLDKEAKVGKLVIL